MSNELLKVNDQKILDSVLKPDSGISILLFTTSVSGHSVLMLERITELAKHKPDINFFEAPAADCKNMTAKFGIRTSPTLVSFKNNRLVGIRIGLVENESILKLIEEAQSY